MTYQNIKTPKFYIDHLQYIRTIGKGFPSDADGIRNDIFNLNPSTFLAYREANAQYNAWEFGIPLLADDTYTPNVNYGNLDYLGILGHNLAECTSATSEIDLHFRDSADHNSTPDFSLLADLNPTEIVNYATDGIEYDGFSMIKFDEKNFKGIDIRLSVSVTESLNKIASLSLGKIYEMPHSPELSLTLKHEYKGVSRQDSIGGHTFTNTNYYKPPSWGEREAWQLGDFPTTYTGRRVWNLSFNYLNSDDLEPYHYNLDSSVYATDESLINPNYKENWFSSVIHYTMGGTLPFIFQPDGSATYTTADSNHDGSADYISNIPEFAICRFDMDTFTREQVAHNVYNIKVKIRETW